jgi:putative hydrolase of the HAD superfamily
MKMKTASSKSENIAIFFDFGGTLVDYKSISKAEAKTIKSLVKKLNISNLYKRFQRDFTEKLKSKYLESSSKNYRTSKIILKEILSDLSSEYGFVFNEALYDFFLNEWYVCHQRYTRMNKHTRRILKYVRKRYQEIGIISDIDTELLKMVLNALKIDRFFSIIVTSEDVSVCKPNFQIFLAALKQLKSDYNDYQLYYVGDSYEKDVIGAMQSGMKTILLSTKNNHQYPEADYRISDLITIKKIL